MKIFNLAAVSVLFTALFAVSAFAQAPAQTGAGSKIAVINTQAFDDDKGGITKYTAANTALEKEFAPISQEIQGLVNQYNALGAEIKKLQDSANAPTPVPFDQKSAQSKIDQYTNLETTIKRKQEDAKAKFERRQQEVLGPIMQDIGKALQDYRKQKGYDLILDISKDNTGVLLAFDETKIEATTKDFIAFYNTRPAGTASTTPPK